MRAASFCCAAVFLLLALSTAAAPAAEQPVRLETRTGVLHGTLDLPDGRGPFPLALMVAGSGPTNRDGNQPALNNDSLKLLGRALAARGIAALRFDKRGIGESAAAAPREEELRIETFVADAVDWIALARGDSRFSRIAVIGHSEGSLIGILAAKKAKVDAFTSLAGAAYNAAEIIRRQLQGKITPELMKSTEQILSELSAGRTVTDTPPELAGLFRPTVQPYMISWIRYDPAKEIAAIDAPVLVVQGATDLQVDIGNAKRLASANKGAKLAVIDAMNHVLKHAVTLEEQQAAYTDASIPIDPKLVEEVLAFLKAGL